MIVFVTTASHDYTLRSMLESHRTVLDGGVIILAYSEFLSWPKLPKGNYILTDLDRLNAATLNQVAQRCDAQDAADSGMLRLNHPRCAMNRWQLSQALFEQGISQQQVRRADQSSQGLRYPVFIRSEIGHEGALTELLHTPAQLSVAIETLVATPGLTAETLWVIEFRDVRNADGWYEKYSVFRVADTYFAHDYTVNHHWVNKGEADSEHSEQWVAADLAYRQSNPHVDLVRPVFELAGIEYGRIDYAFENDKLVVFEINMNPMISTPETERPIWRASVEDLWQEYVQALRKLGLGAEQPYYLPVDGACGRPVVAANSRLRRGMRRLLKAGKALHRESAWVRAKRRLVGASR